jgi:hypothetical protein
MARTDRISVATIAVAAVMGALLTNPAVAMAQDDCIDLLQCRHCVNATEQTAHKFAEAGWTSCNNDEYNPYHDNWVTGATCDDQHGHCYVERLAAHTAAVTKMVAGRDIVGLARYTLSFPGQVILNQTRGAVQLRGCGGAVMGHLPLPRQTVAAIKVAVGEQLGNLALGRREALRAEAPMSFARYLELAAS